MRCLLLSVVALLFSTVSSTDNGVGRSPAMGYNTWNDFRCSGITAQNVKAVADKIVALGLDKVGYQYVNIDDCWATTRDNQERLVPDPTAFPDGMKPVADYVHSKGLKFGSYTDRGNFTCAGRPASQDHETIDAQTFADWGVDYLKEDSCYATQDHEGAFKQYGLMRDALNKTGRPIYFSLCGWNDWYAPVGWSLGNSWRIGGDCNEWESIYDAIRINEVLAEYAKPGGWNDPDMLVGSSPDAAVHNTPDQARTQFSLWSIMAAPLLIGSNILNMTAFDLETYSNTEVIAIDQDPLGKQGTPVLSTCPKEELNALLERQMLRKQGLYVPNFQTVPDCQQVWARPLQNGDVAVVMVNYAQTAAWVTCDADCFTTMGLESANVRDLWLHSDLGVWNKFSVRLDANGASATFRFSPSKPRRELVLW